MLHRTQPGIAPLSVRGDKCGSHTFPILRGSSLMEITALSTAASCSRICCCRCGGNMAMLRLIVSVASRVCRVLKARWPVSAASRAVSMVS